MDRQTVGNIGRAHQTNSVMAQVFGYLISPHKNQRGGSGTKTAPPNAPAMTLDAYASLCAELLAQPARRPDVLQRYQIADETALNELHAFWQKQFAKEPRLHAEWQSKCEAFRDWLTHKR